MLLSQEERDFLRTLCQKRGLDFDKEAQRNLNDLLPPSQMRGLRSMALTLAETLETEAPLIVVGDYDADGALATAIMVSGLRAMGAKRVDYRVPDRSSEGYGLSPSMVDHLPQEKGTLITVDNGINAVAGAEAVRQAGWKLLITDHHMPGEKLPEAEGILNPKLSDPLEFPAQNLCGASVALYLLVGLKAALKERGWFERQGITPPQCSHWLDLAALGTLADLVPLDETNRLLVREGLKRIRSGEGSRNLQLLMKRLAPYQGPWVTTSLLSFQVIPVINAAGRIDNIRKAVDFLLCETEEEAQKKIQELLQINQKRKQLQTTMVREAFRLASLLQTPSGGPAALVLYHPEWHLGMLGLLASQVKGRYKKPTALFTSAPDGTIRGSLRASLPYDLPTLLKSVAQEAPDLLLQFGGHQGAAGVTLIPDGFLRFQTLFSKAVENFRPLTPESGAEEDSDGLLPSQLFHARTFALLHHWIPWGKGCEEPRFESKCFLLSATPSSTSPHWRLSVKPEGTPLILPAWFYSPSPEEEQMLKQAKELFIHFRLALDYSKGHPTLQLVIHQLQLIEPRKKKVRAPLRATEPALPSST